MEKKYCVVCGNENLSRSKLYCCVKCKNQAYYKENRDELMVKHRNWIRNNPEKNRETAKAWREKNPIRDKEYHKEYYQKKKAEKEVN